MLLPNRLFSRIGHEKKNYWKPLQLSVLRVGVDVLIFAVGFCIDYYVMIASYHSGMGR